MAGQEQYPLPALVGCCHPCQTSMTEKATLGLPVAGAAPSASDAPELFNHPFEVKTLISQAGQKSNVVRDPVTTPAVHPHHCQ